MFFCFVRFASYCFFFCRTCTVLQWVQLMTEIKWFSCSSGTSVDCGASGVFEAFLKQHLVRPDDAVFSTNQFKRRRPCTCMNCTLHPKIISIVQSFVIGPLHVSILVCKPLTRFNVVIRFIFAWLGSVVEVSMWHETGELSWVGGLVDFD